VVLDSPYRSIIGPLLDFLHEVDAREPELGPAVVVLPEFLPAQWWHHLLHNQTALLIKAVLNYRPALGGVGRTITTVPYYLER
jgi:hypothetical protein